MGIMIYALLAYLAFIGTLTGLVVWLFVMQAPTQASWWPALAADVGLLLVFAVQHTVMARDGFKRWLIRVLPEAAERSTYVLASSLALGALLLGWQPLPGGMWVVDGAAAWLLWLMSAGGWALGVAATFQFDHLGLFGLRQAWAQRRGTPTGAVDSFQVPALYRYVRHPMMTGFLIALWSTPRMTGDHFVLALGFTVYILVGVAFEERGLRRRFGREYADYAARVPALLPWPRRAQGG